MLHDAPCNGKQIELDADGAWVKFSLANEETKVCIHALHAFLGLII